MLDCFVTSLLAMTFSAYPLARRSVHATSYNYCYDIFRRSVDATPSEGAKRRIILFLARWKHAINSPIGTSFQYLNILDVTDW